MMPELNKIYTGDCLEIMKQWPDKCVDLVVTDPPYGMGRFKGDEKECFEVLDMAFKEIPRLIKDSGSAFFFTSTAEVFNLGNRIPMHFRRMLWMYKPADMTFPYFGWLLKSEAILWFSKNESINFEERKPYRHDCYIASRIGKEGVEGHPTVKPISVIKDLVSRCPKGGIILDPFIGSGTTAIACIDKHIDWLGIEINPEYVKIAEARIAKERSQLKFSI
jgi:site-specific DNA-methyltransferase (adenine-specific)